MSFRCAVADLNGIARGKRLPARYMDKVRADGVRFPLSALNVDIFGEDIAGSPLVFETGDADGILRPTHRGPVPMPWLRSPSELLPMWMYTEDGTAFAGDPRQALAQIIARYAALGLRPVVATEMEFYLVDDSVAPCPAASPRSGISRLGGEVLSLRALDGFAAFFDDLYAGCEAMDIPAEAATSELGPSQFEVNISHSDDALKAADDAWLFKILTQGLARKHQLAASFMAKPFAAQPGSGLHVHFSVLNAQGQNIFANGTAQGSPLLQHAVAGSLAGLAELTLLFAPHANSYDRLIPGQHAPTGICWAHENRTASIRIPGGAHAAKRVENRVAGGDVNPYLLLAAVLGAALDGIEAKTTPPPPIKGNAYDQPMAQITTSWADAVTTFEHSALAAQLFAQLMRANLVATKRQEINALASLSPEQALGLYLDIV